jgi:hypothetical protein
VKDRSGWVRTEAELRDSRTGTRSIVRKSKGRKGWRWTIRDALGAVIDRGGATKEVRARREVERRLEKLPDLPGVEATREEELVGHYMLGCAQAHEWYSLIVCEDRDRGHGRNRGWEWVYRTPTCPTCGAPWKRATALREAPAALG